MSEKKVAIIILCHNGSEYIGDCLSSVFKSFNSLVRVSPAPPGDSSSLTMSPRNNADSNADSRGKVHAAPRFLKKMDYPYELLVEIVVVDNASTDNSVEIVKPHEVTLIANQQNLGFTGGNNVGLQYAIDKNFDYVYLLNQDTEVAPDFLTEAIKVAESSPKIGAVQSRLMLFNKKDTINSIGNQIHFLGFAFAGGHGIKIHKSEILNLKSKIVYPSGAAVLLKLEVLKKIGLLYDEYYMYHEDVDLGWQIWLGGYEVWLAPKSVVYHKYEFSRSIKKYYYMERNRYLVMLQNYKWLTLILISPAGLLMDCAMLIYSFLTGWWPEELKVYLYFLKPKNWQKIFARRKLVQSRRVVPDREIVKRFVGKIQFQEISHPLLKYIANPFFNFYWQIVKKLICW